VRLDGHDDRVVTPDAVVLDLEPATVGSRGIALWIDVMIIGTTAIVVSLAQARLGGGGFVPGWFGIALLLLAGFLVQFGYPIGFETLWRGRTPGKAVMGLRVVTVEGAPVGVRHATIRAAVGLLEITMTAGAVAALTSLVSSRGQRLGDLAAGTLVVRERRATSGPVESHRFEAPAGLEAYAATLDVTAVGPAEYATVRDVLRRAPDLRPAAAQRVAEHVAGALVARVSPPPPDGLDALRWLACVAAAVQRRGGGYATPTATPVHPSPTAAPSSPTPAPPSPTWGVARPTPPVPDRPDEGGGATSGGFAPPH
jgi:uncharacterized RDD family membrane protein YckC